MEAFRRVSFDTNCILYSLLIPRHELTYSLFSGVPNLEYLGIGYNAFEGWPRTEGVADPGFRYRVLKLRQSK